jgi:L-threonylcarbamoyladenylate synthase
MAAKHYAPRARVVMARREAGAVAAAIAGAGEARVASIVATERGRLEAATCALPIVLPDEPEGYASALFRALHAVDEAGMDVVVVEEVPTSDAPGDAGWWAVADRLTRAARR